MRAVWGASPLIPVLKVTHCMCQAAYAQRHTRYGRCLVITFEECKPDGGALVRQHGDGSRRPQPRSATRVGFLSRGCCETLHSIDRTREASS